MISAVWRAWLPEPTSKVGVRPGHVKLVKENIGPGRIVVLAGVNQGWCTPGFAESALSRGAAFMKFGRAPTTWRIRIPGLGAPALRRYRRSSLARSFNKAVRLAGSWNHFDSVTNDPVDCVCQGNRKL
jgi:hypothetical protein